MKNNITFMVIFLMIIAGSAFAQSSNDTINTDNLFGNSGGALIEKPAGDTGTNDFTTDLLTSKTGVTIGGSYHFKAAASVIEDDLENPSFGSLDNTFSIDLGTTLFFDARPDDTIRVLGKVVVAYPFSYKADDLATSTVNESRNFDDVFHVTELFSDFNIDNKVFFRAGKSTINWGVGYFFSPADLLNVSTIDPENPDAELEGPVSVKMNVPVGLNNYYLYVIAPEGIASASQLAVAPKAEFVAGDTEIALGAYYQKDHVPAGMVTFTTGIGDVSFFGEGVVTYGSDKTFVKSDFTTVTYNDTFFFKGTAGARYQWSDDLSNFSFNVAAQYLYNGEGYGTDDQTFLTQNRQNAMISIMSGSGALSLSDLVQTGRHYAAGSFSWNKMFQSDFTLSVFFLGNLSDGSGMLKPALSYSGFNDIDISLSVPYSYGESGDEYTPQGDSLSASLTFSLGGTAF